MSGLYLHIPFCKQACHYCNFHFSTSLKYKGEMAQAIVQELLLRKDYLEDKHLSSVYFGGGTPSLLDADELAALFARINDCFVLEDNAEVTLEANPDDITEANLALWRSSDRKPYSRTRSCAGRARSSGTPSRCRVPTARAH